MYYDDFDDDTECILCGEPSNGYLLCKDCYYEYEGQTINLQLTVNPYMQFKLFNKKEEYSSECIICGEQSNGKALCYNCFNRFKNKEIFLKINKCKFPCGNPINERYEGLYNCLDGHTVKSKDERHIDNFLFENNILHGYEVPLDVGKEKPLYPDFYLKDYLGNKKDVYIEYFGKTNDPDYNKIIEYKMPLYKKSNITLICLYATDTKNLDFTLKFKLNKDRIKLNEINFEEKQKEGR